MNDLIKRPLTEMQKKFVQILIESDGQLSKTEAAQLAGYEKTQPIKEHMN